MFFESSKLYLIRFFFISFTTTHISLITSFAQPGTWVSVYGGNQYDRGRGIAQTSDKGYIVCGPASSYGIGNTDFYLLKIDSAGKYLWQNTFGGINIENAFSVNQTKDSGFVICGYTNSFGAGDYDAYLVKTNSSGILQWEKTFGGSNWDFSYWAEQTNDGGYIIAGETFSYGNNSQAYLLKTNSNGDTLWTKQFGGTDDDASYEVHQTADNGFILAGYTRTIAGDSDFYLVKTDSVGTKKWEKTFGTSNNDICNSVALCSDGGFLLGGFTTIGTEQKIYFIKTNSDASLFTSKIDTPVTGSRIINRIRENKEGDYYIIGWADIGNSFQKEIFFSKWNTGLWYFDGGAMGGQSDEEGFDILESDDSGYVVVGYTASFGTGPDNIIIGKTNKNMSYTNIVNSYVSTNEIWKEETNFIVYPNPTSGKIYFDGHNLNILSAKVFNLLGENLFESKNISINPEIDISSQQSGIYFVEIISSEGAVRKKIILSK